MKGPETHWDAFKTFTTFYSPRLIFLLFSIGVGIKAAIGGWSIYDLVLIAGIIAVWPFQEWFIHLVLLHSKPFSIFGKTVNLAMAQSHRDHHMNPEDYANSFMTARVVSQSAVIVALFWFALWPISLAATGFAFYMIMALHYEWCHFCAHIPLKPKTSLYKMLKKHHLLHHYKNENYWFGVSAVEGDVLLGTCPEAEDVDKSDSCKTL